MAEPGGAYPTSSLRVHRLKCWPECFRATRLGLKPFDVRRHDREFRVADVVELREWDPVIGAPTGETLHRVITYILPGGSWGVNADFCVLGLGPC